MQNMTIGQQIQQALIETEKRHGVTILYACESGSRAWGFASRDSDYDVRFIYQHPTSWYISIDEARDVIEEKFDGDLDVSGWDLRKTLRLLRKSNPPLLEWISSPIVYRSDEEFLKAFRELAKKCYSPGRCLLHYLHMADGNWKDYLCGRSEVSIKKYLYVLRPLLGCIWIEAELGPVPISFPHVIERVCKDSRIKNEINKLIDSKRAGTELGKGSPNPTLNEFIKGELGRLESLTATDDSEVDLGPIDDFFRERLGLVLT
jgi:uncharacterized protein